MGRYVFIAMIASAVVAFALAGWTVKGARKVFGSGRTRPSFRPAFA